MLSILGILNKWVGGRKQNEKATAFAVAFSFWQMTLIMIQVNPPLALGGSFCVKGVHSPANGNRTMLFERGGCITQYAMVK